MKIRELFKPPASDITALPPARVHNPIIGPVYRTFDDDYGRHALVHPVTGMRAAPIEPVGGRTDVLKLVGHRLVMLYQLHPTRYNENYRPAHAK